MDKPTGGLEKFIKIYNEFLCIFGVIFYLTFVVCVMVQVVSRNFLPSSPSWTEEMARYSFIYMVAFGSGVAVNRNEYVGVEFLNEFLEHKKLFAVQKALKLLIKLFIMALCIYILVNAEISFAFIKYTMLSTAMSIPMQYIYFSQILLFSFMIFSFILEIVRGIVNWNKPVETEKEAA